MLETAFTQKLTLHARHSLKEARDIARYTRTESVEPEHLLLAIFMESGSLGSVLLESMGFQKEKLAKLCLKKKSKGKAFPLSQALPLSNPLKEVLQRAYFLASQFQYPYVGTEHLVYALMESDYPTLDEIFLSLDIDEKKIEATLSSHLSFDHFPQLAKMLDLPENLLGKQPSGKTTNTPSLDQFSVDLSLDDHNGQEVYVGRETETERLTQILSRKEKNNPLLIGEPGVGKTSLVTALAKKIKSGNIPKNLRGKRILSLDLALVVAGTNFRGEFEARLKDIIKEASQNKDIILFIDEIHTIIGAGNTTGGLDAANILKPALSRGDIQCIGATTLAEYKKHLEKDPALDRRFQTLTLSEPTSDEAKRILTAAKASYERFHAIKLPTAVINLAVDLSVRYIPDRFLPDKAFDIIDEASALAKHSEIDHTLTKAIATLERNLRQAQKQKDTFIKEENYDEAAKWHTKEKTLLKKIAAEKENEEQESAVTIPVVTEEHILATVSRMANIPFTKLAKEQPKEKLERLKRTLDKQLIGQSEASKAIQETLLRSLSQIGDPNRPLGSFLFLGPTGVGKTLIGKILATEFFGDRSALIRLDMSEFMERHSVAQIIGAPAGYVGYGEGGKLTEQVRRRPYSVVLFDEIEKAHPDVFNVLLQILDEGFLTDAEGRKVSFRNTLVLLTSNIGTAAFTQSARIGFSKSEKKSSTDQFETTKREVLADLKKELKPELLARLDQIIVFNALSPEAIESITKLEIASLAKRLKETGVRLACPMTVARFIAKKSFAPEQGARLVRKNVQDILEHAVAEKIINAPETKTIRLALKNNQVVCL